VTGTLERVLGVAAVVTGLAIVVAALLDVWATAWAVLGAAAFVLVLLFVRWYAAWQRWERLERGEHLKRQDG
jgi:hypothetical protein